MGGLIVNNATTATKSIGPTLAATPLAGNGTNNSGTRNFTTIIHACTCIHYLLQNILGSPSSTLFPMIRYYILLVAMKK